jgi:ubiquinol-cytochrome c reductase iron-sulfur subunit
MMMATTTGHEIAGTEPGGTRRDFLYLTAGAMAAVGTAAAVWPLIDSMNPAADVRALASVELDLEPLELGQRITVKWRGEPVFISRRTAAEIERARADDAAELPDPEPDSARVQRAEWLVVIGVCTHLGCIPKGQAPASARGQWDGWFCPCHGSHYDTSGRIRKGPAPRNLDVPVYAFLDDLTLSIG